MINPSYRICDSKNDIENDITLAVFLWPKEGQKNEEEYEEYEEYSS